MFFLKYFYYCVIICSLYQCIVLVLSIDVIAFMVFYTAASGCKIDPTVKIGYIVQ